MLVKPNLLNNLRITDHDMNQATERISSGKRVASARDDALSFARITTTKTSISSTGIALSTIDYGLSRLESRDQVLGSMQESLMRFQELATMASGGIFNLKDIAPEMNALEQAMLSLANTKDASGLMFAGTGTTTPFTQDPLTKVVTYNGTATSQTIEVHGITMSGSIDGTPLMDAFNAMRAALANIAGGTPPTKAQVQAIGNAVETMVGLRTAGAAEGAAAQNIQKSLIFRRDIESEEVARLESADITEETIKLNEGQKQFEATLKVTSMEINRRRLMDYL